MEWIESMAPNTSVYICIRCWKVSLGNVSAPLSPHPKRPLYFYVYKYIFCITNLTEPSFQPEYTLCRNCLAKKCEFFSAKFLYNEVVLSHLFFCPFKRTKNGWSRSDEMGDAEGTTYSNRLAAISWSEPTIQIEWSPYRCPVRKLVSGFLFLSLNI